VAKETLAPVENRWIGQRHQRTGIDIAMMARRARRGRHRPGREGV